jgi:hypothetical protein
MRASGLTPGRAARAGERSVARRLLRAAAPSLADAAAARALGAAASDADLRRALERHPGHAHLAALAQARPPRGPAARGAPAWSQSRASALLRPQPVWRHGDCWHGRALLSLVVEYE